MDFLPAGCVCAFPDLFDDWGNSKPLLLSNLADARVSVVIENACPAAS
jgi:hypothetical protein